MCMHILTAPHRKVCPHQEFTYTATEQSRYQAISKYKGQFLHRQFGIYSTFTIHQRTDVKTVGPIGYSRYCPGGFDHCKSRSTPMTRGGVDA